MRPSADSSKVTSLRIDTVVSYEDCGPVNAKQVKINQVNQIYNTSMRNLNNEKSMQEMQDIF